MIVLIKMFAILTILAKLAAPDLLICELSGLRQFLAIQSSLEMMKNAFYFTLKALFILNIFSFLLLLFAHVEQRFDEKVNFKIYDVINRITDNYNIHIGQYLRKWKQPGSEIWAVNITWKRFFLKNHSQNVEEKLFSDCFLKNKNWVYFWISRLKFCTVCFFVRQIEVYRNILKISCRILAFVSY